MKHLQSCREINCLEHCPCDCHLTATKVATDRAIYQKGFGDGHKEARDYAKKLIEDEVWKYHNLTVDFLKKYQMKASDDLTTEINEMCLKSHNEVLEKIIKLL